MEGVRNSNYFKILRYPTNFKEKKQFARDVEKIIEKITILEVEFCKEVLDDDLISYDDSYKYYHDIFNNMCTWIEKQLKLKMVTVNRFYFSQSYKSVV